MFTGTTLVGVVWRSLKETRDTRPRFTHTSPTPSVYTHPSRSLEKTDLRDQRRESSSRFPVWKRRVGSGP